MLARGYHTNAIRKEAGRRLLQSAEQDHWRFHNDYSREQPKWSEFTAETIPGIDPGDARSASRLAAPRVELFSIQYSDTWEQVLHSCTNRHAHQVMLCMGQDDRDYGLYKDRDEVWRLVNNPAEQVFPLSICKVEPQNNVMYSQTLDRENS